MILGFWLEPTGWWYCHLVDWGIIQRGLVLERKVKSRIRLCFPNGLSHKAWELFKDCHLGQASPAALIFEMASPKCCLLTHCFLNKSNNLTSLGSFWFLFLCLDWEKYHNIAKMATIIHCIFGGNQPLWNVYFQSSYQEVEFISPLLESVRGHMTCFGHVEH